MPRKHISIFPGTGVDFYRAERSYDGVWLRSGQSIWLPHLLPAVYQAVDLADFSFSTFRVLPMGDPALMPLPPDSTPYQALILAPVGEPYPDQWGSILFHSSTHPPCVASERFVPDNGGIRRVVQTFFKQEFIDSLRLPERRRVELWVRHSLKIHDMLPDAYDSPRWLKEIHGLDPEAAAQKIAALRQPLPASQYDSLRQREHNQRGTPAKMTEVASTTPEAVEQLTIREIAAAGRRKREKAQKATRGKVRADRANEVAAKAFAEKKVKEMEAEGRP